MLLIIGATIASFCLLAQHAILKQQAEEIEQLKNLPSDDELDYPVSFEVLDGGKK